jgi:hypothetical protein
VTPFGTALPMGTLFWQPEVLSEPHDYQRKSLHISLACPEFKFNKQANIAYISS